MLLLLLPLLPCAQGRLFLSFFFSLFILASILYAKPCHYRFSFSLHFFCDKVIIHGKSRIRKRKPQAEDYMLTVRRFLPFRLFFNQVYFRSRPWHVGILNNIIKPSFISPQTSSFYLHHALELNRSLRGS